MAVRELYHGTKGDNILDIIRSGVMKPNSNREIFFSEHNFASVLMHGADTKRKLTFAIKLSVEVPEDAVAKRKATHGVADTWIVSTAKPIRVKVMELYVREPRSAAVKKIVGASKISAFLK